MQNDQMERLERLAKEGDWEAHIELSKERKRRGFCEQCGDEPAHRCTAMTAYSWDGTGEDPNADLFFCMNCAEEYSDYWKERWAEYYAGLL